jgi:hypothetical protein
MVIDPTFLDVCLASNEVADPAEFPLEDDVGEGQNNVSLNEIKSRAQENRGKMLRGWTIWVSTHIANGVAPYVAIIMANGGKCLPFQGRPGSVPRAAPGSDTEDEDVSPEPAYLISGPSPTEQAYWTKFRQMAGEAGREPRIVQREWLLDAALKQEVQWHSKYVQVGEVEDDQE